MNNMKNILSKLAKGENSFDCIWNGVPNKCTILKLDLETSHAYVKFDNPVKTKKTIEEMAIFANSPDETVSRQIDVESYYEWISIKR